MGWRCVFHGADEGEERLGFWYSNDREEQRDQPQPGEDEDVSTQADASVQEEAGQSPSAGKRRRPEAEASSDGGTDEPLKEENIMIPPPRRKKPRTASPSVDEDAAVSRETWDPDRPDGGGEAAAPAAEAKKAGGKGSSGRKARRGASGGGKRKGGVRTSTSASASQRKLGEMVGKWAAATAEMRDSDDDDDAEGGLGSEEAKDKAARKREQKLEEWRVSALRDPDAQNNANFQPLQFDWRARLKRTRAESEDGKPDQREAAKRGDSVEASLAELQEGLPSGWRVFHDPSSDDFYYGHVVTREARWTRPKK